MRENFTQILDFLERTITNKYFDFVDVLSVVLGFTISIFIYYSKKNYNRIKQKKRVKKLIKSNLIFEYGNCIGLDHWSNENIDIGENNGYNPFEFYRGISSTGEMELLFKKNDNALKITDFGKNQLGRFNISNIEETINELRQSENDSDNEKYIGISAITRLRRNNNEQSGIRIRTYPIDSQSKQALLKTFDYLKNTNAILANENKIPKNIEELVSFAPLIKEINICYFVEDENDNIYCKINESGLLDFFEKIRMDDKLITYSYDLNKFHSQIGLQQYEAFAQDLFFLQNEFSLAIIVKLESTQNEISQLLLERSEYKKIHLNSFLTKKIQPSNLQESFRLAINCQLVKQNKIIHNGI